MFVYEQFTVLEENFVYNFWGLQWSRPNKAFEMVRAPTENYIEPLQYL